MKDTITMIATVLTLIAVIVGFVAISGQGKDSKLGAVGNMAIENYVPAIMYNDGYYSEKAISTTNDLTVDTNTLRVDSTNNRVGVGTTTPSATLSLGAANATTTIFAGKLCIVAQTPNTHGLVGNGYVYYTLAGTSTVNGAQGGWATSTTPCY